MLTRTGFMGQTVRPIGGLARGWWKQFPGDEDRRAGGRRLRPGPGRAAGDNGRTNVTAKLQIKPGQRVAVLAACEVPPSPRRTPTRPRSRARPTPSSRSPGTGPSSAPSRCPRSRRRGRTGSPGSRTRRRQARHGPQPGRPGRAPDGAGSAAGPSGRHRRDLVGAAFRPPEPSGEGRRRRPGPVAAWSVALSWLRAPAGCPGAGAGVNAGVAAARAAVTVLVTAVWPGGCRRCR